MQISGSLKPMSGFHTQNHIPPTGVIFVVVIHGWKNAAPNS